MNNELVTFLKHLILLLFPSSLWQYPSGNGSWGNSCEHFDQWQCKASLCTSDTWWRSVHPASAFYWQDTEVVNPVMSHIIHRPGDFWLFDYSWWCTVFISFGGPSPFLLFEVVESFGSIQPNVLQTLVFLTRCCCITPVEMPCIIDSNVNHLPKYAQVTPGGTLLECDTGQSSYQPNPLLPCEVFHCRHFNYTNGQIHSNECLDFRGISVDAASSDTNTSPSGEQRPQREVR